MNRSMLYVLFLIFALPSVVQATILNGGFESGLTSWTVSNATKVSIFSSATADSGTVYTDPTQPGGHFASISSGGSISQSFNVQTPGALLINWAFLGRDSYPHDDAFSVSINGYTVTLASISIFGDYGDTGGWQQFSYPITTPGNVSLTLTSTNGLDRFIDSTGLVAEVRFEELSSVPEIDVISTAPIVMIVIALLLGSERRRAAA